MIKDKVVRILAEVLESHPIWEMAIQRKRAIQQISFISPRIKEEVVKLYLFQHSKNQDHWKGKLKGWLTDVLLKNPKRGKFTQEDYKMLLWEDVLGTHIEVEETVLNLYEDKYPSYNPSKYYDIENEEDLKKLYNNLKQTYTEICKDLVKKKLQPIENYIKYD